MKKYKIPTIPGDGIKTEVMDATLKVLTALDSKIDMYACGKNSKI
jgi:isocitrate/isopropylmalate dehydrogenase